MASIDDRVVSMSFDNAKFEAAVAKTLATLQKLDASLKKIGTENGLHNIEKAANKLNLSGATTAFDKLNSKFAEVGANGSKVFTDTEGASNRVTFGSFSTAIESIKSRLSTFTDAPAAALDRFKTKLGLHGGDAGLNNIEAAANRIKLEGPSRALDQLSQKLAFPGADRAFGNIEAASGRVRLSGVHNAIQSVTQGFSVLQGAAAVALGSIAAKAATAGAGMLKSLSFGPIQQGFEEYATNLNSIQTILANTKFQGSNLQDVNAALKQLNHYSDQTIYNFSEMAKNIGTFTAAGVGLEESVASIKGIANLAALSGSNSQQASTAMYQLSQAIASGRVSLQDWNSVVNAGMGGATFQRALATTAQTMGTVAEGAVKIDKATGKATINGQSFRESITAKPGEESWLTSDVLTNTLQQFTGDLSEAELAAQGFNKAQIEAIQETAITAKKAATEVKTAKQAFDVVKESIGSGWSATFQTIFGNFEEAKETFTDLTESITGFVSKNADARNEVLKDWKQLGGRTELIEGIKNAFEALASVVNPIKDAFRDIFPRKTGQDLADLTSRFSDFMDRLKIGPETAENLRRTFRGFFAVLSIGKQIISGVISIFGDLLGAVGNGSGGFLKITGTVGDFLVSIDETLKKGDRLEKFFDGLGHILSAPLRLLSSLTNKLGGATDGVVSSSEKMSNALSPLGKIVEGLGNAWDGLVKGLRDVTKAIGPEAQKLANEVGGIAGSIIDAFVDMDFERVFDIIQTGLIGGIFVALKKGLSGGVNIDLGGGVLENLSKSLTTLTGSLKSMQRNIQADTLLKIALAIGALAVGVKILSTIDPDRLGTAMTAVAIGLGQLVGAMALLTKGLGFTSFLTMPFIAASLIALAVAIDVLAIAVFAFSRLSWEELLRGLAGVAGALTAIGIGLTFMPKSIALIAAPLLLVAGALNLLAIAMKIFATMSWEEIGKGLVSIGVGLTAVGLGMKFIGPGILYTGPALIAVALALNALALAVRAFGSMDLMTMAKGLGGIAVALALIGLSIRLIPPTVALQAAGLILLSIALTSMAGAIALMGTLGIKTIAQGLAAIGASLLVLGIGLKFMAGTIPGAAALMLAATALAVLVPTLGILGSMKWTTIVTGLIALGATLGVLAAAGTFASAPILALGAALLVLSASVLVVGAGLYLMASGLAKLGGEGTKGITAAMVALTAFVAVIPVMIIKFLKGLVEVLAAIAELAPKVVASMVKILDALIEVVIRSAPRMAQAVLVLIEEFLRVLTEAAPRIIAAGWALLIEFLKGINDNIGEVTTTVASIIVNFLTALANSLPSIMTAGINVLLKFLEGVASQAAEVVTAGVTLVVNFLRGITENMPRIVRAGVDLVVSFVNGIAQNVGRLITAGADFIVRILQGIGNNVGRVARAATDMIGKFFDAAVEAALDLIDAGARAVINFINGVAKAIRSHSRELGEAGANLGTAIIQGVITGMWALAQRLVQEALNIISQLPGAVAKFLGIRSPSKVFAELGRYMMLGLNVGVRAEGASVVQTLESVAEDMVDTMTNSLSLVPDLLGDIVDLDPVITPVLDLSNVEAGAEKLGDLTNVVPITAAVSYNNASSISAEQELSSTGDSEDPKSPPDIKFEQNNYSPVALSEAEIYRRTKNQLSQAKDALGLAS